MKIEMKQNKENLPNTKETPHDGLDSLSKHTFSLLQNLEKKQRQRI